MTLSLLRLGFDEALGFLSLGVEVALSLLRLGFDEALGFLRLGVESGFEVVGDLLEAIELCVSHLGLREHTSGCS